MTSSLLTNDLLGLKNKLENLEQELMSKMDIEEKPEIKMKSVDETLEDFLTKKDPTIKLNVGGKIFKTKLATLLSVKDSLFYKIFSQNSDEKTQEIFFDRSYRLFPLILDYLRTKHFSRKNISCFDIEDLIEEANFYNLTEFTQLLEENCRDIEFVSFEGAPRYSTVGTHNVHDLTDPSMTKGICVQTPYHIIIELNYEHEIAGIECGGYNGNTGMWGATNGANAKIYTSLDKNTWTEVGQLPSTHGARIQTVRLTHSIGKYIKFQHNNYLGLGYLKVLRNME
jgi:hypothetical protein